jgi:hypothetical protein
MDSIDLFQAWRNANQAAVVAAKAVLVKSILALDGRGEPPSAAEIEQVRTLRCMSDDLFELTMARLGEAVEAQRLQPPPEPGTEPEHRETTFASTWAVPMQP